MEALSLEDGRQPVEEVAEVVAEFNQDDSVQGFFDHEEPVFCVDLSADEKWALSGGSDDVAYVWDLASGERVHKAAGHTDSVVAAQFSRGDGTLFATASMDGTVRVYRSASAELVHVLDGPSSELEWMQWHPRGPVIAAGSADGTVWMWNSATGSCMRVFAGHLGSVMCGSFSSDGKLLCTGSADCTVFVWDPKSGKPNHHFQGPQFHTGPVTCVAVHPDPGQPLAATGSQDAASAIVHMQSGRVLTRLNKHTDGIECVDFSSNMPWLATGGLDANLIVWDTSTSQSRVTFAHPSVVTCCEWHPSEPLIFSSCTDGLVRLWDARSGQRIRQWRGHQEGVLAMRISRDGQKVVTGSDDGTALVFSMERFSDEEPATALTNEAPREEKKGEDAVLPSGLQEHKQTQT